MDHNPRPIPEATYSDALGFGLFWFVLLNVLSGTAMAAVVYLSENVPQWPSTNGKISRLEQAIEHGARGAEYHVWKLAYTYATPKGKFTASRFAYNNDVMGFFENKPDVKIGEPVTVFYDPQHPDQAVLDKTPPWVSPTSGILPQIELYIFCVLFSCFIVWGGRKWHYGQPDDPRVRASRR